MRAKFKLGEKVRFTERAPVSITRIVRGRTRTVVAVLERKDGNGALYELGGPGKSTLGPLFRSYMLEPVNGREHVVGRPKLLIAPQNQHRGQKNFC